MLFTLPCLFGIRPRSAYAPLGAAFIPFAIQVVIFTLLLTLFTTHFDTFFDLALSFLPTPATAGDGIWQTAMYWFIVSAHIILRIIFMILIVVCFLLVTFVLGLIVAGPFNEILSEKTESIATGRVEPPFSWRRFGSNIVRSLIVESQKALLFLGIPIIFLFFHFLPVIGSFIAIGLTGVFEMWATGFAFTDYPMSRRMMSFRERTGLARDNLFTILAFGCVFWIPGLIILCSPPLVVGGTLLYSELKKT
jgi:CysZ protein